MLHTKNGCEDIKINNFLYIYTYIYNYLLISTIYKQYNLSKWFVIKFV